MNDVTKSATKIVFILMAIAVIAALFVGKISGEQFMTLAIMTFAFFYKSNEKTTGPPDVGSRLE